MPLSLIGCAAWDIVKILQKQRQHVTQFKFYADSERDDQPPWRFRKIRVHYQITGQNLKEESIKRAIELSETKYCSIFATLRDIVEIQTEYEVVQA